MGEVEKVAPATAHVARRLIVFARPHWRPIALAFVMLLGKTVTTLAKPWPLKFALDEVVSERVKVGSFDRHTLELLVAIAVLIIAVDFLEGAFNYFQTFFINRAGRTIVFDLRAALLDKLQNLSLQYHSRRKSGDVLTRVTGDVKALNGALTSDLLEIVLAVTTLGGMSAILVFMDPWLAMVPLVAAPFMFSFLILYGRDIRQKSRDERRSEGKLANVLHESLGSVRLTRAYHRDETVRKKFLHEAAASLESGFAATLTSKRVAWGTETIWGFVVAGILGFGVYRVVQGQATVGDLTVFVYYARHVFRPLRDTIKSLNALLKAAPRAERVVELLDLDEGIKDRDDAVIAPRLHGHVVFDDVHFEYEAGCPVLRGIDLDVPAGQVVAIVGPTGCGKTTLTSLVPRLFDPTQGTVRIDGRDVRDFTMASLRAQVSMVLQESVLLDATVAENIAYGGNHVSMEEVVQAARAAGAHEFVTELPDGYESEVGERGDTLSGGQRQRIAIARAFVRNAPILVLDEPLAGLDAGSAEVVLEALRTLMKGRTVFLITHQIATVDLADVVVVMHAGKVVVQGRPRDLLHGGKLERYLRGEVGALWRA
jgi:ABC-type multidrug transport system fused ATPase/permease subunit